MLQFGAILILKFFYVKIICDIYRKHIYIYIGCIGGGGGRFPLDYPTLVTRRTLFV